LYRKKNIDLIREILEKTHRLAVKYKTEVFLVGGPVRDLLMAKRKSLETFKDLDLAVTHHYKEIGQELAEILNAQTVVYPRFMTMTLTLPNKIRLDIAQTRKEYYPQPAVLPTVFPATIIEDLARRDFTINAMAILLTSSFLKNGKSVLLDPFSGQSDLRARLIRILHPNSFIDDPTRIFRALRFACRLEFSLEKETQRLLSDAIQKSYLTLLSKERILYELKMICKEKNSQEILQALSKLNVFNKLFGQHLEKSFFKEHIKLSSDEKLLHLFSFFSYKTYENYPVKKEFLEITQELKERRNLFKKLSHARKPSTIFFILNRFHIKSLKIFIKLSGPKVRCKIKLFLNKLRYVKSRLTGNDLLKYNIPTGPIYKQALSRLLAKCLDGELRTLEDEKTYLLRFIKLHRIKKR
jgi:tRNA nucleotidyltransferase (CCA-adding enzyme)